MPITMSYTAFNVNDTPNLIRYVVALEVVPPPSKVSNCRTYQL